MKIYFLQFSRRIWEALSLLFTGYRSCVPGYKAVDKWSWPLTCLLYEGKEWVELYIYSPYALVSCTEMTLLEPVFTLGSADFVAWNVGTSVEYEGEVIWKEAIHCQFEVQVERFVPVTEEKHEGCRTAGFRAEMRFGRQMSTFRNDLLSRSKRTRLICSMTGNRGRVTWDARKLLTGLATVSFARRTLTCSMKSVDET
jgi:hypothetical protein